MSFDRISQLTRTRLYDRGSRCRGQPCVPSCRTTWRCGTKARRALPSHPWRSRTLQACRDPLLNPLQVFDKRPVRKIGRDLIEDQLYLHSVGCQLRKYSPGTTSHLRQHCLRQTVEAHFDVSARARCPLLAQRACVALSARGPVRVQSVTTKLTRNTG